MKKIILLAFATLMMVGCDIEIREPKQKQPKTVLEGHNQTIIIDSCEYISEETRGLVEHKGNCRFCRERLQKELKELVEQLKK